MNKLTFALLLVGLCASACLARTSPQIRRPFKFTPGQTYIYEYRGRQWNGLAKLADQYAGLTLDCDVILQALPETQGKEIVMKLNDVKVEQLHTQALDNNDIRKLNPGQEVNERQLALYKEELSKSIRFTYLDGKVVRFIAEAREAEWSINIKKSILSLFQLDLAPTRIIKSPKRSQAEQIYGYQSEELLRQEGQEMPLVYPVYEESFGGICETQYELDSVDNVEQRPQKQQQLEYFESHDVLNVTKTVNYKNCLTDPSVSYDRHSFKVNTQTYKGKLFGQAPTVAQTNYYPVPGQIKAKYSNAYTAHDAQDNVAAPVPVQRHSYTKYNITTASQALVDRRSVPVSSPADMMIIEGIYSEGKIKYETDGDVIMSDTQQSLKLISCTPTGELARVIPDASNIIMSSTSVRSPAKEYTTIQCELSNQKLKFYQALWKYAQLSSSIKTFGGISQQQQPINSQLYSHKMVLPFALSASWFPIVASSNQEQELERSLNPEQLAKSYETIMVSLAEDILSEDVAQSKRAGEKVIRIVNMVAFMPKGKLVEVYDRIVENIQHAKQQQIKTRGSQAIIDNGEVAKWKIVRKLFLDSLPLAGSKQAIEMIELLIETNRVKSYEAKEMCEAVPANLRYPDTEIIDAFIRISQLPQVRKSRSLFAACSIAAGKMIGQAYAKSQDASYKPTTHESINKLPVHLREDELIKQVVEEADPRRQLPIDWQSQENSELYDRLVLDEQDLTKYVMLYKQMLNKAGKFHEKVIYLETLAHMKVPQVLSILEPYVTGRLSLSQCLGTQPLDISRPVEQSQWYNRNQRETIIKQQQQQQYGNINIDNANSKDWSETDSDGAEECNYMRTIAIYALAHVAHWSPNKVQTMLLPVFDNTYEPYQIRIAAFTTMMLTPIEEHILERIASQMWREPCKEVASFVVGTIDTMSKMNSPAMTAYKHAAQKAADSMPKQYLDTWRHSWMAGGDHFNAQKQSGLNWVAEIVKSNVSSIPRAAYWRSGRFHGTDGTKYDNHFEVGFTSKGLESLLKSYIAYNKQQQQIGNTDANQINLIASIIENLYDAKDDIVKHYYEARDQIKSTILGNQEQKLTGAGKDAYVENFFFKRQQPIDGVNSHAGKQARQASELFEGATSGSASTINSRNKRSTITLEARRSQDDEEEAKLTFFSKIFDSTTYHALDKKQLIDLIEKADDYVKMVGDELIMGGKLHYVKMIMPSNMWHVVPSQLGLPIVVTHRTPIVASIKIDGAKNGQLTSNKLSQIIRQQVMGGQQQVPNTIGQNFATMDGVNITAIVHPKIMYSNYRFMFAVEQAVSETYGVQTEKSHQISLPMEVSVAYSQKKQLVSIAVEPKTTSRVAWKKEAAKTFISKIALGNSQLDMWLGQEHLIRVPSQQSQYQRLQRPELFVPSLLGGIKSILNEPREQQLKRIEELETPYKFEHRAIAQLLGLEFYIEGATDDEDVVRVMSKPELVDKKSFGQLQWSSVNEIDDLDQHSKSGPFGKYLHIIDSAMTRPSKYLECYTTLKPATTATGATGANKSPIYRLDFLLNNKQGDSAIKFNQIFQQGEISQQQQQQIIESSSRRPINIGQRIDARTMEMIEQNKKFANQYSRQQNLVEAY